MKKHLAKACLFMVYGIAALMFGLGVKQVIQNKKEQVKLNQVKAILNDFDEAV